ncbi:MAG TPA: hypothetical protein PK156_15585 [Polyangium sp.]|nr:hypothetical protein [Polyangium sp.]
MNHTTVHQKFTTIAIFIGKLFLFGSIQEAHAQTSKVQVILEVPEGRENVCGNLHFFDTMYDRGHGGDVPIWDVSQIKIEVLPNAGGLLYWRLEIRSPQGTLLYQAMRAATFETDCNFAVAEAAYTAGLAVAGRSPGPLISEGDYEVEFAPGEDLKSCQNPQMFRWFFDRHRQDRRFPPHYPKYIHLHGHGDLSKESRIDIDLYTSSGVKVQRKEPLSVTVTGHTECSKLLQYAANKLARQGMDAPRDPLVDEAVQVPTWHSVLPRSQLWVGPGYNIATDLSFRDPRIGHLVRVQYVPSNQLMFQASLEAFGSRQVPIGRWPTYINIEQRTLFSIETCLRPLPSAGVCVGAKGLQVIADGGNLRASQQATVYHVGPSFTLVHESALSKHFKFQFFIGGEWYPRPASLVGGGFDLVTDEQLQIKGGMMLLTDFLTYALR